MRLTLLILCLLLVGCAAPRPVAPALPPLPPGMSDTPKARVRARASAPAQWPSLRCEWPAVSGARYYRVYFSEAIRHPFVWDNFLTQTTNTFTDLPRTERGFVVVVAN